jgi:hypothetical protein
MIACDPSNDFNRSLDGACLKINGVATLQRFEYVDSTDIAKIVGLDRSTCSPAPTGDLEQALSQIYRVRGRRNHSMALRKSREFTTALERTFTEPTSSRIPRPPGSRSGRRTP